MKWIFPYNNSQFTQGKRFCFNLQYNIHFLKHIFLIEKTSLCIPSEKKSLDWILSHFLLEFFTSSLLENPYFLQKFFKRAKQVEIKRRLSWTVMRMWQLFPTKLTDGFLCSSCSMRLCIVLVKPSDNWL